MNKIVLIRTLKTAFAALFSIILAQEIGLEYSAAAGIIAILNVFATRKETLIGGLKRTLSAAIALTISAICFEVFAYNTWVFALYLLIFVPVSFLLKLELGIGPSSVLVTHLLAHGHIDAQIITNEIALMVIGTSFAILTNIYAPSERKRLNKLIKDIDEQMKFILNLFGRVLTEELNIRFYDQHFERLKLNIEEAIKIASIERDNIVIGSLEILLKLKLRNDQAFILSDMYNNILDIPPEFKEGNIMSHVLKTTSIQLTEYDAIKEIRKNIKSIKENMENLSFSEDYDTLIIRSALMQIIKDLDRFTEISKDIF